jgi:NADH dehydrogenase
VGVIGRSQFRGFLAWMLWAVIHILFLISFRNRVAVALRWLWDYVFFERGARLITGDSHIRIPLPPAAPSDRTPVGRLR